jgi:HEAT repeat protein
MGKHLSPSVLAALVATALITPCSRVRAADADEWRTPSPYADQVAEAVQDLNSPLADRRLRAVEALGFLRAYAAADRLLAGTDDPDRRVRRAAALALGWCGGRDHVAALIERLDDTDWSVRQAAFVGLENLTVADLPFTALADRGVRTAQRRAWQAWWQEARDDRRLPRDRGAALDVQVEPDLAEHCPVTASTVYRGPPEAMTDPESDLFWQTKNVPFPQHCTVDLGVETEVGCVRVQQYGPGFCMTDWSVETSRDGVEFSEADTGRNTVPLLESTFPARSARFVRVVSRATENPTYPTTFRRVSVYRASPADEVVDWDGLEQAFRSAGALGLEAEVTRIVGAVDAAVQASARNPDAARAVQAGLRALGRLGTAEAVDCLARILMRNTGFARYAADALGDTGLADAAPWLVEAYPRYARTVEARFPAHIPLDDRPGFEAVDRAFETAAAIEQALSRLPVTAGILRPLVPLITANVPGDFDGAMLYEPEAPRLVSAYLLDVAGARGAVRDLALSVLGALPDSTSTAPLSADERSVLTALARKAPGGAPYAASLLPVVCGPGERSDCLVDLLEHDNGWVRINAAKALMFTETREAAPRIHALLRDSRPEAEHGWFAGFLFLDPRQGQDEYDAPSPCWREAFCRALGRLGTAEHVPLLARLLEDERNGLEVRGAAAQALGELATPAALEALEHAALAHDFHSVRLIARECLARHGRTVPPPETTPQQPRTAPPDTDSRIAAPEIQEAVVFIRGSNDMPNDFQIDIWRQTYSTTDSGPTYRLGTNLFRLSPPRPDGEVVPLTTFADGYVADCEVSWDGNTIVFARRAGDDPWWHVWTVRPDGSDCRQLTFGPYHDVQPVFLPDDRIAFSTSRIGLRDEYHGYPATGLATMAADGTGIRCIGFNLGRDNEPAVLPDGRIVFSRLELFYSRLKTELTVHALFPDGSGDVTLYGPERREFWAGITRRSREGWWGESGPRHRVLRLTQPQPVGEGQVLCASSGGPVVAGPGRFRERLLRDTWDMAVTSSYPLEDGSALCAATPRAFSRGDVDLGLYRMDLVTGALEPLYNTPEYAEFEPRPLAPRPRPPVLAGMRAPGTTTAKLVCATVFNTQDEPVRKRGRLVRVIEGQPFLARHHTHTSRAGEAWRNHVGTLGRVLATLPLAPDGSFAVEVPADRLLHLQVLDGDRRVVGNQQVWMPVRPGETRSCAGCHERPDTAPLAATAPFPQAVVHGFESCLPVGGEFTYRAKLWQKGVLPDQGEERTRTVRAVNLLGRH